MMPVLDNWSVQGKKGFCTKLAAKDLTDPQELLRYNGVQSQL